MTNNMFFIANWKMFGDLKSVNSIKKVIKLSRSKKYKKATIVYCPPYTLIDKILRITKNTKIKVGAQNCHYSQSNVVRYNESGFVEDLPELISGRFSHACSWYINSQDKMVKTQPSIWSFLFHI